MKTCLSLLLSCALLGTGLAAHAQTATLTYDAGPDPVPIVINRTVHYVRPAAQGFSMETLIGGSVSFNVGEPNLIVVPSLRLGGMWRPFAFAINLSYFSNAIFSDGYSGRNVVTVGLDLMPSVWHSFDDRARMYVLVGFNLGAVVNNSIATSLGTTVSASDLTGGLSVGLGGRYFLHPNFALGVELAERTQFVRPADTTSAVSSLTGSVLATFIAGH